MDALLTTARVVVSLAAVLGLVLLLGRAVRRRGAGGTAGAAGFAVIGRHALGRSAGVAVVRLGDQALVLGVTEHSVRLLVQAPLGDVVPAPAAAPAPGPALAPVPLVPGEELVTAAALTGRRAATATSRAGGGSVLAGSALSPATWSSALDVLRERTTRR